MKSKIIYCACVAIVLAVVFNATIAYFTAQTKDINRITSGKINVALKDMTLNEKEEEIEFPTQGISGITAGESINKIVYITNEGENAVWVRVKLAKIATDVTGDSMEWPEEIIKLDLNTNEWSQNNDGYYYYNKQLNGKSETEKLFTKVDFSKDMGNVNKGDKFNIEVKAQAVQSKNNGKTVYEAKGWDD